MIGNEDGSCRGSNAARVVEIQNVETWAKTIIACVIFVIIGMD